MLILIDYILKGVLTLQENSQILLLLLQNNNLTLPRAEKSPKMLILASEVLILLLELIHDLRLFGFLLMIGLLLGGELKNEFLLLDESQFELIEFLVLLLRAEMIGHSLFFSFLEETAEVVSEHVMERLIAPLQGILIFLHRFAALLHFLHLKFCEERLKLCYFRISIKELTGIIAQLRL
jgi:hypothetical protein